MAKKGPKGSKTSTYTKGGMPMHTAEEMAEMKPMKMGGKKR